MAGTKSTGRTSSAKSSATAKAASSAAKEPAAQVTIGRIVHYLPTEEQLETSGMANTAHPAIVTAVGDGVASLFVMFGAPGGLNGTISVASARESSAPAAGCWHWPPRAG